MTAVKRTRTTRSKLHRGLSEKGYEYYYSKKPSTKRTDHVDSKSTSEEADDRTSGEKKTKTNAFQR